MKFYQSFKVRFLAITTSLILISGIAIAATTIFTIKTLVSKRYSNQVSEIVTETAKVIDVNKFLKCAKNLDETDPDYIEQTEQLRRLKEKYNCIYLYTMKIINGTNAMYIFDGSGYPGDDEYSYLGETEDIESYGTGPFDCMTDKEAKIEKITYQEEWGYTISAYMPLIDSKGNAVGFIGCDFNMDTLMGAINTAKKYVTYLCILILPLILVIIYFALSGFLKDLGSVTKSLDDISKGKGDLTAQIKTRNRGEIRLLADSFNAVLNKLCEMIGTIKQSTTTLSETSAKLIEETDGVQTTVDESNLSIMMISDKTKDQTNYMNSVVNGIKETETEILSIDSMLQEVASGIQDTSSSITQMSANVDSVSAGITKIAESCSELVRATENGRMLQKNVSQQIGIISKMANDLLAANQAIQAISSKTNLLAMNASIEAAHAGESGKGFAVVGGEIRKLAENSAKQTDEINNLLSSVTAAINDIVSASDESTKSFDGIGNQIEEINSMMQNMQQSMIEQGESIRVIVDSSNTINDKVKELNESSRAMKTQSQSSFAMIDTLKESSNDIATAVTEIAEQMNQIKDLSDKTAQISVTNKDVSNNVSDLVNEFKTE